MGVLDFVSGEWGYQKCILFFLVEGITDCERGLSFLNWSWEFPKAVFGIGGK